MKKDYFIDTLYHSGPKILQLYSTLFLITFATFFADLMNRYMINEYLTVRCAYYLRLVLVNVQSTTGLMNKETN